MFQFSAPHDDTLSMLVPGTAGRSVSKVEAAAADPTKIGSRGEIMTSPITHELPVTIPSRERNYRSKHGERDFPGLLFYYPGVDKEVAQDEREKKPNIVRTNVQTVLKEAISTLPQPGDVDGEQVFRLSSNNSPVSNRLNGDASLGVGEDGGTETAGKFGGSVLAQILSEMKQVSE